MKVSPAPGDGGADIADVKVRSDQLRLAAGLPGADLGSLLDAALAELDAAMAIMADATEADAGPDGASVSGAAAVRAERRLLRAVFHHAPTALFLIGVDCTVRRANLAASRLVGTSPGYATGQLFTSFADPRSRAAIKSQLAATARTGRTCRMACSMLTGEGTIACELAARRVAVSGDDDRIVVAVTPLRSAGDSAVEAAEESQAAPDPVVAALTRRLDMVTAANRLLLEGLESSEPVIIQRLARLLTEDFAAWAIIDTRDQGTLRRHTVAGPDADGTMALAQAVLDADPPAESPVAHVASTGCSLLLAHAEDHGLLGETAAGMPVFLLLGGTSVICVPIRAGEVIHGVLTLVRGSEQGPFGLADAGFAEAVAEHLGRAIAAHRVIERRAEVADALMASLLPREPKTVPGVDVAATHVASTLGREAGGDFYDVFPAPDGWGIAVGDVCGQGQGTAAVTAAARHAVRVLAHSNPDPASVLALANEILLAEDFTGRFVTAAVAHLSWQGDLLRVVIGSAGHPAPVLVTADGRARLLGGGGVPLGIFDEGNAEVTELFLEPGELLFLYTDGLTDARSADQGCFRDGLADRLSGLSGLSPADLIAALEQQLADVTAGVLLDNVTMLAMRAGAPPADQARADGPVSSRRQPRR